MADVVGQRHTRNTLQANQRPDYRDDILLLEADAAPLTVLTTKLVSRATTNPKFGWFEDQLQPRVDAINNGGGYTNVATALVVDNAAYFATHDTVKVTRTGEVIRVLDINIGTQTLNVVRGVGGGNAALLDNDELFIVGSAQPEGDTAKPGRSNNEVEVFNYCQIQRRTYEATRTAQQTKTWTNPGDWKHQARKQLIEHKKDKELTYLFGKPSESTAGGTPRRTTGGAYHYIATNVTDMGGTMTEAEFFGGYSGLFRYGTKSKFAFAARTPVDVVNAFPRGKLELIQGDNDDTYGLSIMKYRHPHGVLNFMTHNLLSDSSEYSKHILVLDLALMAKRYMFDEEYGAMDLKINEHIEENDRDGRMDEIISEDGLEFGLEKAHGYYKNITG